LIIDGGLATHLEDKYGCNLHDEKWSTLVLDRDPQIVENAHGDYFQAGAQAAITCTYRTNPESYGDDINGFHQSIKKAV
jgi:homocysteine S-methyltransferase